MHDNSSKFLLQRLLATADQNPQHSAGLTHTCAVVFDVLLFFFFTSNCPRSRASDFLLSYRFVLFFKDGDGVFAVFLGPAPTVSGVDTTSAAGHPGANSMLWHLCSRTHPWLMRHSVDARPSCGRSYCVRLSAHWYSTTEGVVVIMIMPVRAGTCRWDYSVPQYY